MPFGRRLPENSSLLRSRSSLKATEWPSWPGKQSPGNPLTLFFTAPETDARFCRSAAPLHQVLERRAATPARRKAVAPPPLQRDIRTVQGDTRKLRQLNFTQGTRTHRSCIRRTSFFPRSYRRIPSSGSIVMPSEQHSRVPQSMPHIPCVSQGPDGRGRFRKETYVFTLAGGSQRKMLCSFTLSAYGRVFFICPVRRLTARRCSGVPSWADCPLVGNILTGSHGTIDHSLKKLSLGNFFRTYSLEMPPGDLKLHLATHAASAVKRLGEGEVRQQGEEAADGVRDEQTHEQQVPVPQRGGPATGGGGRRPPNSGDPLHLESHLEFSRAAARPALTQPPYPPSSNKSWNERHPSCPTRLERSPPGPARHGRSLSSASETAPKQNKCDTASRSHRRLAASHRRRQRGASPLADDADGLGRMRAGFPAGGGRCGDAPPTSL
eukprot:gene8961-biopygen4667